MRKAATRCPSKPPKAPVVLTMVSTGTIRSGVIVPALPLLKKIASDTFGIFENLLKKPQIEGFVQKG
jgi:hypothetical protein